jgi:DNA segregation ATPase FtsK/SpoIIIE, S-DNA-T family
MGGMSVGAAVELVAAALVVGLVLRLLWWCALTEPERQAVRLVRRVRREWVSLAHNLGLCHEDRAHALAHGGGARVVRVPRIRVEWDPHGVVGAVTTVPGVGLDEYRKHARFIADAWGCHAVRVTRLCPGVVQLRGLLVDSLGDAYGLRPDGVAADVGRLHVGRDEWGEEVTISLTEVSGITVGGLPGYGKTSLIGHWFAQLAPSPAVQFAVLDGKGGADYAGLGDRCFLRVDDDMEQAREALRSLCDLLRARQGAIRAVRKTANAWREGPSEDWPLVVIVVDESHTYVQTGRRQFKEAAEENAWHLEQLVKKGRSVAMLTVLITQKQTDDAAVAALGADIRNHAEVSPVRLVGREHVGVAVASLPGRPGFTRIRTPYVAEEHVAEVARRTADLRRDPSALLDGCVRASAALCVLTVGSDEASR